MNRLCRNVFLKCNHTHRCRLGSKLMRVCIIKHWLQKRFVVCNHFSAFTQYSNSYRFLFCMSLYIYSRHNLQLICKFVKQNPVIIILSCIRVPTVPEKFSVVQIFNWFSCIAPSNLWSSFKCHTEALHTQAHWEWEFWYFSSS